MEMVYFGANFVEAVWPQRMTVSMPSTQHNLIEVYFFGVYEAREKLNDTFFDLSIFPFLYRLTGFSSHKKKQYGNMFFIRVDKPNRVWVGLLHLCHKVNPPLFRFPKWLAKRAEQLLFVPVPDTIYSLQIRVWKRRTKVHLSLLKHSKRKTWYYFLCCILSIGGFDTNHWPRIINRLHFSIVSDLGLTFANQFFNYHWVSSPQRQYVIPFLLQG